MFDRTSIVITMRDLGYTLQAHWLLAHHGSYLDISIDEYFRWMEENVPSSTESLAQAHGAEKWFGID
ncbi:hypothetical protein [Scytonema sp. NUACC26]|uniref:hypothetical protein n=1 Tax=Scytonema sp. NUACC26 TaxID=3140176 RepID=UPI0034DC449C